MKILLINSEYPPTGGGAGNASAHIARLLSQYGHETLVLTSRHDDLPRDEVRDGVRIMRAPALRRHLDRSNALEQISFILGASVQVLSLVRQFKPDCTLAFFGLPSGAVAHLAKKLYRIPYVVSLRGGDVPGFRPYDFRLYHRVASPVLHSIWHDASAIVANSNGLYDLARAFDRRFAISIIPNGVNAARFSSTGRQWSPPHILSVGRVVYQKGLDLGLRALAGLKDLPWQWTIVGDGPQLPVLRVLAEQHNLQQRIHFAGWLSSDHLKQYYAAANLFLFPSRHEGMPNAVLEAMASGLPVIATRIAGNEELVLEGETGALVPSESVDELRAALQRFLVDAALREQMGRAARQRVERDYTWERVAEQYENILEAAVK